MTFSFSHCDLTYLSRDMYINKIINIIFLLFMQRIVCCIHFHFTVLEVILYLYIKGLLISFLVAAFSFIYSASIACPLYTLQDIYLVLSKTSLEMSMPAHLPNPMCQYQVGYKGKKAYYWQYSHNY